MQENLQKILRGAVRNIEHFFFKPAYAGPLAIFRMGVALVLLWQVILMRKSFLYFFSHFGFVQSDISSQLADSGVPRFDWIISYFSQMGFGESGILSFLGILYITSLLFLLSGLFTRHAAFLAWFLHWSFTNTGYSGSYGADMYAHFFLFYLIWLPSHEAWSLDVLLGRIGSRPSYQARLGLRIVQLHMCISYLVSGLEKATGELWYNGEIIWRALNTPGYTITDFSWLANVPALAMVIGWGVLIIEIFYCIFVWPKKTRMCWVVATCSLHLGIAVFLKLPVFGVLMCVPTFALFGFSSEPKEARGGSYLFSFSRSF